MHDFRSKFKFKLISDLPSDLRDFRLSETAVGAKSEAAGGLYSSACTPANQLRNQLQVEGQVSKFMFRGSEKSKAERLAGPVCLKLW